MPHDQFSEAMERFGRVISNLDELKREARWAEVGEIVGRNLYRLVGVRANRFSKLTETDLLASLIRHGPPAWVPYKQLMLIALLKEAGDFAAERYPPKGGVGWYLRALHLLCDARAHEGLPDLPENPGIAPRLEHIVAALGDSPLPSSTRLVLAREYERDGMPACAVAHLQAAVEKAPGNVTVLNYAIAFFERLKGEDERYLRDHGLSRQKVQVALADLSKRKSSVLLR